MDSTADIFLSSIKNKITVWGSVRLSEIQNKEILISSKDTYCFQQMQI